MTDRNSPAAIVESLRAWKARNNWSAQNIALAIQIHGEGEGRVSSTAIADWISGKRGPIDMALLAHVRAFMDAHFDVPGFNDWRAEHDRGVRPAEDRAEDIMRRREENERARQEYVARCLASERAPLRSTLPSGIIPPHYALLRRSQQQGGAA